MEGTHPMLSQISQVHRLLLCSLSSSSLPHSPSASSPLRGFIFLACALFVLGTLHSDRNAAVHAQSGGGTEGTKGSQPLDLPSGGHGEDESDEDPPETIRFYGESYEGDGFFWCLDRSGSMTTDDRLGRLKIEVTEALASLSDSAEIGLVSFSDGYTAWQPLPREADSGAIASATEWVLALEAGGFTCLGAAGTRTIEIANLCEKESKQIFVVSDGLPFCGGQDSSAAALQSIRAANWQSIPVNTIFIGNDPSASAFMRSLTANGGTYREVSE